MTAAKTPPERLTLYWCDSYFGIHVQSGGGTWNGERLVPAEFVLASVVEKRERALREAMAAPSPGLEAMARVVREARALCLVTRYGRRGFGPVGAKPLQDAIDALDAITITDAIRAALAAADEVEAKTNE